MAQRSEGEPKRSRRIGRRVRAVIVIAAAAVAVALALRAVRARARRPSFPERTGVGRDGMEYLVVGDGPKTALIIQGGPGSELPTGPSKRLALARCAPYIEEGYTVWNVSRRRNMPVGHTIADMADDYAAFISDELPNGVDLVIGVSLGGMIAQHLAARHPGSVRRVALAPAAGALRPGSVEFDRRWAAARADGRFDDAGAIFLELVMPGPERAELRQGLGPLAGRMFAKSPVPKGDLLVEAEAEAGFDARAVLPSIQAPVLIVCGDQDEFFPPEIVEETAELIPDCTVVVYEGQRHLGAGMSPRVPRDVIAWLKEHPV
ncbi:alpha/beta hydrolase [Microbacter sp. GSS18]|nr:alpha/beta hydrolase [Microbacter sp. GSS18]